MGLGGQVPVAVLEGVVRWGSKAFLKMRFSLELLWGEGIEVLDFKKE